jgi:hypothetical protein
MLHVAPTAERATGFFDEYRLLRPRAIAIAVSLAFASASMLADASADDRAAGKVARHVTQIRTVFNCDDDGAGSLRAVIASNQTQSGDVIDLSQLACGTITLSTGAIAVPQADLTLIGPGKERLVIGAGQASRLFDHASGTLSLEHLSLASGTYHGAGNAFGGCVRSTGSVYLFDAAVEDCHVSSDAGVAGGGAISAANVTLVFSRVSGSSAASIWNAPPGAAAAFGGGIAATEVALAKYSEISDNAVQTNAPNEGEGGGLVANTYALITHSTIDANEAPCAGGLAVVGAALGMVEGAKILDSTISDNHSDHCAAVVIDAPAAYIANSTLAFNHADVGTQAGLSVQGTNPFAADSLTLQSSIVANNTAGASVEGDAYVAWVLLFGSDNLVMSLNGPPPAGFVATSEDPKLGPLQRNGGPTKTRALQPASPAIGIGNDAAGGANDQRGSGYPRTTGPSSTVDIGAFQFDSIFASMFND